MNKNKKLLLLGIQVLLFTAFSCTKQNYEFDNGYNTPEYIDTVSVDVDTNRFKIDYSKYTQARLFPGLADADEPRLEDYTVSIDLDYVHVPSSDLRISVTPGNWQSTGMYAPAGELIVIDVPGGVYGLTAQIGAHVNTDDIDNPQRDRVIFTRQVLFPGKNYLRNLYGGLIYILPERPLARQVDLKFTGTLRAPSFKLGVTSDQEWKDMVRTSTVPWFELEGNRIVFTLETAKLKKFPIQSPTELMETWDQAIKEGYWDWTGMTEGNPDPKHRAPFNKWRIVHDVLFRPTVAQVSGYPIRARNSDNYFRQAVDLEGVKFLNWGTYHELGHNMQQGSVWSFAGNGEVTNNLFHFKVSKIFGKQSYKIAEVWPAGLHYIQAADKTWDGMETDDRFKSKHNDIKLIMYAQIFEKYGYDFMTYLYTAARNARFTSANNQQKIDFFYERLSEFVHMDMEPFLNNWGISVSNIAKKRIAEDLDLPLLGTNVWLYNPVTNTGGDDIISAREHDRTGWTVAATNAQSGYPAANLLDGDANSIWHSCYNNCIVGNAIGIPSPTNFISITFDTKENISAEGIYFVQRQNHTNNHMQHVGIEISDDGSNWTDLGTFELSIGMDKKFLRFSSRQSFRYFRVSFKERPYNDNNPAMAEIGTWYQ